MPMISGRSDYNFSPLHIAKDYVPVLVSAGITDEVTEALDFTSITAVESAFSLRFADVFSLIKFLIDEGAKLSKQRTNK
ncbi:MAG: hypothetical protein AB4368_14190 [Xenococcaceae cyanobacterium]